MTKHLKIGFLGDGQLARLSALAAHDLGYNTLFYGTEGNGPCSELGKHFFGELSDLKTMLEFAKSCDLLTLENEFIDITLLKQLEKITPLYPSTKTFSKIDNKLNEKITIKKLGIPMGEFIQVTDLNKDLNTWTYPLVLKASKGGYDGFGNKIVSHQEDLIKAYDALGGSRGNNILAEKFIPFEKEVAVTVARNSKGEMMAYPVVDTIQKNNICTHVIAPANISQEVENKVIHFAGLIMESLDAVGVFSFEFFLLANGEVLFNESAPRPHNSAHYTLDGSQTSQFENHIRAITNMELGETTLKSKHTLMFNLLGTYERETLVEGAEDFISDHSIHFHLYEKKQSRPGRKMGHVTITGKNLNEMLAKSEAIAKRVKI